MIREAAAFAAKAHEGSVRKGSEIPYIYHPMEVALEVRLMTRDESVIAAAYLHDVLEDTPVTPEELRAAFGERILDMVLLMSEDKSLSWYERKSRAIENIKTAPRDVKTVMLADKLCNMRSTARDFLAMGRRVWERFNEKDSEKQRWYYEGMAENLSELCEEPAYQELCRLIDLVFKENPS